MNHRWHAAFREAAVSGSVASLFSAVVLALAGQRETPTPAAPLNATSQWLWGRQARFVDQADGRHTVAGYLIHHGAACFWAALHARALDGRPAFDRPGPAIAAAAGTAALAAFVDYNLTPDRFTPGFEHRLSRPALAATYAAFAVGLAVGSLAMRRR
ncbi:MAG TPA: hypothetical protein VEA40_25870 [Ramlibacter sp.]|nr:hypothetical protein [Ramlibacter sp.]